jgi:hypothetical protein
MVYVYDPKKELTLTSPYVDPTPTQYNGQPYARVYFLTQSGTKNLTSDIKYSDRDGIHESTISLKFLD